MELDDLDAAEGHFLQAEELTQSLGGDGESMLEVLCSVAECAERRGDLETALCKLERCQELAKKIQHSAGARVAADIARIKELRLRNASSFDVPKDSGDTGLTDNKNKKKKAKAKKRR